MDKQRSLETENLIILEKPPNGLGEGDPFKPLFLLT